MRWWSLLPVGLVVIGVSGCASAESRDQQLRALRDHGEQLQLALDEERAKTHILSERLGAGGQREQAARAESVAVRKRAEQLEAANSELLTLLEQRAQSVPHKPKVSVSPLPGDVDRALLSFAQRHSGRVWYDRQRGAISFANDRLFELGGDSVARESHGMLGEFAGIASMTPRDGYELLIVGHTDQTPITRAETLERHPSNWHLSVHRAIAVKDVLVTAGLPEARMGVMGYGPYRPIGSDKDRNRRVEAFFVLKGDVSSPDSVQPD